MAYTLNFPPNLTEEELELKEMFERLRKLKKVLHSAQVTAKMDASEKRTASKMSREEVEGATEEAKRLAKSGAVTIRKSEEKHTFKRSKVLDRKLKDGDSSSSRFQPYSSAMFGDFTYSDERTGSTIYIRGYDFMEETLRSAFKTFGNIVRIHIEERRKSAFIEYETNEEAVRAIREMNGNMLNGITLKVSMARRQGNLVQFSSPKSPAGTKTGFSSREKSPAGQKGDQNQQHAWSKLAANSNTTAALRRNEGRNVVTYDDTDIPDYNTAPLCPTKWWGKNGCSGAR